MYQDIAVARGTTYDTLNKRMDRSVIGSGSGSDFVVTMKTDPDPVLT